MKKLRVPLPMRSPAQMLEIARKVLDKHVADAENSKLDKLDWESLKPAIENAVNLHEKAELYRTLAAQCYQDRDLLLDDVIDGVQNSRDILTGIFKKDMKKLGSWGFPVIEAVASKKGTSDHVTLNLPAKVETTSS